MISPCLRASAAAFATLWLALAVAACASPKAAASPDPDLAADRALDALLQQLDGHAHDGGEGADHEHGPADDAASADVHVHPADDAEPGDAGHHGAHDVGPPQGACAEPAISTMHPSCQGNEGCTVHTIAPCACGCARCWYDECVELACDVTPGCAQP